MKFLIAVSFLLLFSLNLYAQGTMVVNAPVDHLFVPNGFDNNDNVEVVVTGKFPNPCYIRNKVDVDVKGDLIHVRVTSLAKEDNAMALCESLAVPFTEVVTIGNLQGGDYRIIVNEGSRYELRDNLSVAMSSSDSVDEHLYAQVDYVELGFTGGLSGDAILVGHSLSPCLKFDRVEYLDNGKDSISVLPIMQKISNDCPEKKSRLQIPIKFKPGQFSHDRLLLFVRSVEGKSVYSIIDKR